MPQNEITHMSGDTSNIQVDLVNFNLGFSCVGKLVLLTKK